ncbi:MAG: TonB-dependent receptor [Anaeromyxobacteraceae bacterium]
MFVPVLVTAVALSAAPEGEPVEPAVLPEQVVVTGTRSPRPTSSLPTTVEVLEGEAVRGSGATTADAALRQVPSFQTFRRSSSLAADPSSQGLALRGVGPSAVSRALLLDDGVPANDPFGGWVAWRSVPRLGLDRVEVAPGGASALYGSQALGGVVALVPRPIPEGATLEAESSGGALGTAAGALLGTARAGPLGVSLEGDALRTDGYRVVAPASAGAIDGRAGADHATGTLRLRWDAAPDLAVTAGAGAFAEDQDGGTRYTRSAARALTGRLGAVWSGEAGRLEALGWVAGRTFTQDRTRALAGRSDEELAARQRVPSRDLGGSLVLAPSTGGGHAPAVGLDVRRVSGEAGEDVFPAAGAPSTATVRRDARGAQVLAGVFAEDALRLGEALEVAAALRLDAWRNAPATTSRTAADGTVETTRHASRADAQLSPRLAVRYRPHPALTLRASAYRAFRAPTLNELYRTFQVGTIVTAPEPALRAETLTGAEAGPELRLPGALRARLTGWWSVLDDPATIVTLAAPLPDGATRQRANLGRLRIRGLESSLAWGEAGPLAASVAYTLADARVVSAPGHEELVGSRPPQDPVHRVAGSVRAGVGRVRGQVDVAWSSGQWEDDRNTLRIAGAAVVDASVAVRVGGGMELFGAAENLLDRRYLVGRAGIDTVGAPRLIRVGLRIVAGR